MSQSIVWNVPARMGAAALGIAQQVGGVGMLAGRIVARLFPPRLDRVELVRNMHRMGVQSVPIIVATAVFVGALMVIQAAPFVMRFNAKGWIGWGAGYTTLRELGPLLIALMFNGRVGANNTAELATMTVTEQVDALRALAIDPISYLILPRVISMILMMFVLTVLGDGVAVIGSIIAGEILLGVDPRMFVASMLDGLETWDLFHGLIKSVLFGIMIAMTSCHFGLSVKGGAPGVGRSVNAAVVAAASGIFIADYLSTFVLK